MYMSMLTNIASIHNLTISVPPVVRFRIYITSLKQIKSINQQQSEIQIQFIYILLFNRRRGLLDWLGELQLGGRFHVSLYGSSRFHQLRELLNPAICRFIKETRVLASSRSRKINPWKNNTTLTTCLVRRHQVWHGSIFNNNTSFPFSFSFAASRLLRRKIPCTGHLMTPRRLWIQKVPTQVRFRIITYFYYVPLQFRYVLYLSFP